MLSFIVASLIVIQQIAIHVENMIKIHSIFAGTNHALIIRTALHQFKGSLRTYLGHGVLASDCKQAVRDLCLAEC